MPKPRSSFADDFKALTLDLKRANERNLRDIAKERRVLYRKLRALNAAEAETLRALQTLAPYTSKLAA